MTDIVEVDAPVGEAEAIDAPFVDHGAEPKSPFAESASEVLLDKEIDLLSLQGEIAAAAGHDVQLAIQHTPEGGPDVLYVNPVVDSGALRKILADHVPPVADNAVNDLIDKARSGKVLTTAELTTVLSGVLGRVPLA